MSGSQAAEIVMPDRRASRRQFDRAAASFGEACFVHDETRSRLLERLPYLSRDPELVLDLGTAHGAAAVALKKALPSARVIAVDSSRTMLDVARASSPDCEVMHADAESLPLADSSVDLIFANLLLPWCDPQTLFSEVARVLMPSGVFMFTTLGPDTLSVLARAWSEIDALPHVHGFIDMHDIGDTLIRAGLEEAVMDTDRLDVAYRDLTTLGRDLRLCGGRNVANGRRKSLTSPGRWRRFERALDELRIDDEIRVCIEMIFGHAFGPSLQGRRGDGEVSIPVDDIGRS